MFLDGKYGLTENGSIIEQPVELDWFVASNSHEVFNTVVSEMMGFNWKDIGHLRESANFGIIPDRKKIPIIGDLGSLKRDFSLNGIFGIIWHHWLLI